MRILSIHPCGTSRVLLHAVKSYDMGPSHFTSHPRGRCAAGFITLKNPSPWLGSNPQPLGPVASTLTTTPPRQQGQATLHSSVDGWCRGQIMMQISSHECFGLTSCILLKWQSSTHTTYMTGPKKTRNLHERERERDSIRYVGPSMSAMRLYHWSISPPWMPYLRDILCVHR
jgi:hypothetical protein